MTEFETTLPLVWLVLTLVVFLASGWLNTKAGKTPLLHPVLLSLSVIIVVLQLTDTSYETYMQGGIYIHFLLGPAVVALAIPLYDHRQLIKKMLVPLLLGAALGALVAAISALGLGLLLGLDKSLLLSLAPKSVTSPIAIAIAEKVGGLPSLAAGLVLITGAMGCLLSPLVNKLCRVTDPVIKGFSLGVSAHAMGTAYAFEYGMVAGAFAGLAMGITGAFTAFMLPVLLSAMQLL